MTEHQRILALILFNILIEKKKKKKRPSLPICREKKERGREGVENDILVQETRSTTVGRGSPFRDKLLKGIPSRPYYRGVLHG